MVECSVCERKFADRAQFDSHFNSSSCKPFRDGVQRHAVERVVARRGAKVVEQSAAPVVETRGMTTESVARPAPKVSEKEDEKDAE